MNPKTGETPVPPGRRTGNRSVGRLKAKKQIAKLLTDFHGRSQDAMVLDPACGSGNFLYVALHLLLDLEKEPDGPENHRMTLIATRSTPITSMNHRHTHLQRTLAIPRRCR